MGEGASAKPAKPRLTYKEQKELESLPEKIIALESELSQLHATLADPAFFRQPPSEIVKVKIRLQTLQETIAASYKRWEELESADS
jgi:ABC transport system ATP-binding/permease protein